MKKYKTIYIITIMIILMLFFLFFSIYTNDKEYLDNNSTPEEVSNNNSNKNNSENGVAQNHSNLNKVYNNNLVYALESKDKNEIINSIGLNSQDSENEIDIFWKTIRTLDDTIQYKWLVELTNSIFLDKFTKSKEIYKFLESEIVEFKKKLLEFNEEFIDYDNSHSKVHSLLFNKIIVLLFCVDIHDHDKIKTELYNILKLIIKYKQEGIELDLFLLELLAENEVKVTKKEFQIITNAHKGFDYLEKRVKNVAKSLGYYNFPKKVDFNKIQKTEAVEIYEILEDYYDLLLESANAKQFWKTVFTMDNDNLPTWLSGLRYCFIKSNRKIKRIPLDNFAKSKIKSNLEMIKKSFANFLEKEYDKKTNCEGIYPKYLYLYISLLGFIDLYKKEFVEQNISYVNEIAQLCLEYDYWGNEIDIYSVVFLLENKQNVNIEILNKVLSMYKDNWRYNRMIEIIEKEISH